MQLRKIGAMALGALMAGVSMAGAALAADYTLSDFPAPFVENGTPNFLIVVGSGGTAAGIASDMVGAINIAARLGGETVTTTGGTVGTTVSEGVKIASPGEDFNYGDNIYTVKPTGFTNTDFPTMLKKDTYHDDKGTNKNDYTYTQEIDFTNSATVGEIVFDTNDNLDNKPVGTYLYFPDTTTMYTYTLEFGNDVDVADEADLENTKIEIEGKTYTISKATVSGGAVTKLELLGGASEQTVDDETSITVTVNGVDYTITPSVYSSSSVTFTVSYNGESETTDSMNVGDTYELADGTEIGVRDILFSTKESKTSAVTFYVGAQKITLESGQDIKVNGKSLDDYDSSVTITSSSSKLSKISFTVTPKNKIWIGEGESWTDPIFGAWKLMFTGIEKTTEDIKASASGDDGTLKVTDIAGNNLEIPFIIDPTQDGHGFPGDELASGYTITADGHASSGNLMIANTDKCTGTSAITACEGVKFLAVNSGGEARILEIKDIDTANHQIDIRDDTTGEEWDNKDYTHTDGTTADTISLGGFMNIQVKVNETGNWIEMTKINDFVTNGDAATSDFKTSYSGEVDIAYDGTKSTVTLYDDTGDTDGALFSFDFLESSDDMEIQTSDATLKENTDSDTKWGLDAANWGALMSWDSKDKTDLTISYPEKKAIADVYMAPATATATTTSGEVTRTGVIKTPVGAVDTQVTDAQKTNNNLILVGGPCVNKLTADALGLTYPACGMATVNSLGIPENGYMIKLVKDAFAQGKYALVVFGVEAKDTTAACAKIQADMAGTTGVEYIYPAPLETTTTTPAQ
ncbi:MAG: S-layer protein [Candidatus Aenigmarchaeota archaeon]|nr:S-layer protein [Candidatus Aenigmarchaeota archaeon]